MAAELRPEVGVHCVDPSADPDGATLFDLIGHRVGQGPHREPAGNGIAVVVQQGVELTKARLAVASQDPERC